MLLDLVEGN